MTKRQISKSEDNVVILRTKLNEAERKNFELRNEISQLIINSELRLHVSLEKINYVFTEYLKLNPHRINFSKKEQFDLSVTDVLWIHNTYKRLKTIYLKSKITNVSKDGETDNIISNTDRVTFEQLLSMIDLSNNCLVKVTREFAVNVEYFNLKNNFLELNIKNENSTPVPKIKISKKYLSNFKLKKENYTNIISYRKQLVSSQL
jgi:hypothetical protein